MLAQSDRQGLDDPQPEICTQLDVLAAWVQRVRNWALDLLLLLAAAQCALQSSWTQPNSEEAKGEESGPRRAVKREKLSQGHAERSRRQRGSCGRGTEMTDRLPDPMVHGLVWHDRKGKPDSKSSSTTSTR